jgi:hypothetical protein
MTLFNPWADQGLIAYDVWAKDDCAEDRSLNVLATSPEHAIKIWRKYYAGWSMDNFEQGPKVRTMGFPQGAGPIAWNVGKPVSFERVARAWRGTAACIFKNVKWVRA